MLIKYYFQGNSSFSHQQKEKKLLEYHKDRFQFHAITIITIQSSPSSNSTVGQKSNKRSWKTYYFFPIFGLVPNVFSFCIWVNDIKTLATIYDYFSFSLQL